MMLALAFIVIRRTNPDKRGQRHEWLNSNQRLLSMVCTGFRM